MNEEMSRRRFFSRVSMALSGLVAAVVGAPIIAYLLSPLLNPAQQIWRAVGELSEFEVGRTVQVSIEEPSPLPWAGQTGNTALWIRRESERDFIAFAVYCTHLGCPVSWVDGAGLFVCPCHGGIYYEDGRVAGGPPPRPLVRHEVRIVDNVVEVRTRPVPLG